MVAIIHAESANKTTTEKSLNFRWMYIVLPAAVLLLSIILAAWFYHLLPSQIVYHFEDGAADRWMNRGALIAWMIIPQFVFILLALAVISGVTMLSTRFQQVESTPVRKVLSIMGNMVALPQIILAFAMLDIFLYNAYQIRLISLWIFALIVIVLGSIILGSLLIQVVRQSRQLPYKSF